jgi:predicted ATPase/DNA-binding winged helix-turn-helix (wHTH) protein
MKQFGSFQFDTQNECLWHDGRQISLKPKPFSVLRYLVEHPQRLVTHDELLEALWPETYVQPQVLRTYVLELRKLLGDDAESPQFIATIPKRGYRFLLQVAEAPTLTPNRQVSRSGIVGRDRELQLIGECLQKACTGERQIVFVTGEAGMGKTALIDAFCQGAGASGEILIARGQCVEGFGNKEPYYPILELLAELCGSRGTSDPHREKRRGVFDQAAPGWSTPVASTDSNRAGITASNHEGMLGELCEGLEALAKATRLLLIVEDLHWADAATLDFISALARRRTVANLMLVATYRAADVTASYSKLKQLRHDLVTRRIGTVVALRPLKESAVAAYVAAKLAEAGPGAPPKGVAAFVHQQSEGNPLFMIATVEHLISQKLLVSDAATGRWRVIVPLPDVDVGVPHDLSEMIELQIEQREDSEQRLLEAGAIIGSVFPVWAAAAAHGVDVLDAEEQYEALARKIHFLHAAGHDELPDGTRSTFYVLAHRVYREVLYRRQPVARRSRAHLRVAERLKTLFADREADIASELATHFEAAGDWIRAADAMCVSAENAIARQAGAEAAALFTRSLELLQNLDLSQRTTREARIQQRIASLAEELSGD